MRTKDERMKLKKYKGGNQLSKSDIWNYMIRDHSPVRGKMVCRGIAERYVFTSKSSKANAVIAPQIMQVRTSHDPCKCTNNESYEDHWTRWEPTSLIGVSHLALYPLNGEDTSYLYQQRYIIFRDKIQCIKFNYSLLGGVVDIISTGIVYSSSCFKKKWMHLSNWK